MSLKRNAIHNLFQLKAIWAGIPKKWCKVKVQDCFFLLTKVDTFCRSINSLPNDEILDSSKFKAFADDKINLTQKLKI